MSLSHITRTVPLAVLSACFAITTVAHAADGQSDFERGYYLQTHEGDLQAAIASFDKVVTDENADEQLREEAKRRAAQCREDIRATDFASLMPPESIAYVEFANPGAHVENVIRMLGLAGVAAKSDEAGTPEITPLGDGLYFPDDFHVSPALIDALKNIKGAAMALTSIKGNKSDGVAVIHPGDSGLIRGLLETAVQLLKPEDPIAGFRTYRLKANDEHLLIAVTQRMFFITRSRAELEAAVNRLGDSSAESLASQERFQALEQDRKGSLLFGYVDGKLAKKSLGELKGQEAIIANFLDLDHLNSVSAVLKTTDDGIELQAKMDLAEGHRNLVYSLLRTAPMTRRSLEHVPSGAAAVVIVGLNPPSEPQPVVEDATHQQYLALMDVGRELFGNIEEVSLFVMPTSSGEKIPDGGLILAVKDPEKSEQLWNQLMALPAMFDADKSSPPRDIEIEGHKGQEYQLSKMPPIAVIRLKDRAIVAGTRQAVEAVVKTDESGESITNDDGFQPLLDSLTAESSKAVLVHVGRTLQAVMPVVGGKDAQQIGKIAPLLDETRVVLVTDEKPTQFTLRIALSGLPDVPTLVKALQRKDGREVSQTDDQPKTE